MAPLFERLGRDGTLAPMEPAAATSFFSENRDPHLYPTVIGLGPRAEQVVAKTLERFAFPEDAGVYRPACGADREAAERLALRLDKTTIGLLVIDPDDAAARDEAPAWAQQFAEADVYFAAAILLDSLDPTPDRGWRARLGIPAIDVIAATGTVAATTSAQAILPGLTFASGSIVCYDVADVRRMFDGEPPAWTTAVHWQRPDAFEAAMEQALAALPSVPTRGVVAMLNCALDFSLTEFDDVWRYLADHFDDSTSHLVVPLIDAKLSDGERLLSLTIVGG